MNDEAASPGTVRRRPYATQLGSVIRERRWDLDLSQAELAEQAGVTKAAISAIELGNVKLPTQERLRAIAEILGLRHVDLLVAAGLRNADEVSENTNNPGYDRYPLLHQTIDRMSPRTADALQDLIVLLTNDPAVAAELTESTRQGRKRRKNTGVQNRVILDNST